MCSFHRAAFFLNTFSICYLFFSLSLETTYKLFVERKTIFRQDNEKNLSKNHSKSINSLVYFKNYYLFPLF